ncbi:MAG TPA: BatA domain-containing protein, partial [Tahibacter sp.]|uniref:BatA domain-containing protein n=1 Tax=Tahibacter sp. TaxID=2056211 RepID=UPI002C0C8AAA
MSLGLLLPLGLTALAALVVPLLLHLNRRQEQKPTPFAALRFVRGPARPRRRIRLEQWPLLLLRLALVAVAALLIATPVRRGESDAGATWVVVVPGVDAAQARAALAAPDADWRWLAPGFPAFGSATPVGDTPATASLLRELDTELPPATALRVIAPSPLLGLDGGAIRLSRPVDWRVVDSAPPVPAAAPALPLQH